LIVANFATMSALNRSHLATAPFHSSLIKSWPTFRKSPFLPVMAVTSPPMSVNSSFWMPSQTVDNTPFSASHACSHSPLMTSITVLIMPSTALIAVLTTTLTASKATSTTWDSTGHTAFHTV